LFVTWIEEEPDATYGIEDTCADEVYIANKRNRAQLTHIYRYDDSLTTFSANVCGNIPMNLTINPPDTDDCTYFGICTDRFDPGPFCNLVFNVGTAATYTNDAVCYWEYYDGVTPWAPLTVSDDTVALLGNTYYGASGGRPWERLGTNSVAWEQPDDWTEYELGETVTGWWVRCRVDEGVSGVMTLPANSVRAVYTCTWNHVSVASSEVAGDIPMRGRVQLSSHIDRFMTNGVASRLVMGLRTLERADPDYYTGESEFTSFINLSDTQPTQGYSVSVGTLGVFDGGSGDMTDAPTGRWIHAIVPNGTEDLAATLNFSSRSYEGTFHCYLRYIPKLLAVSGSWPLRVRLEQYFGKWSTPWASLYNAGTDLSGRDRMYIADLGCVRLHGMTPMKPEVPLLTRISDSPSLFMYLYNPSGASAEVDLIDLVLIPADEWLGDVRVPFSPPINAAQTWPTSSLGSLPVIGKWLDIDGARMPYYHTMSVLRNSERSTSTRDTLIYSTHASEPILFQVNSDQEMHFLSMIQAGQGTGDSLWCSYPYPLFSVRLSGVRRYIMARGSR